jgi:iron complex transport system substrate-binding protein
MDCLRRISESIPDSCRPTVYYYDPVSPDWTAGPGTHVSEAIVLAGGRNVAADAPVAWPRYALERLLVRQPDVILAAAAGSTVDEESAAEILEGLRRRHGWRGLRAVRDSDVCAVPADWLMRPGPRVFGAIEMLGRCLHPEREWACDR